MIKEDIIKYLPIVTDRLIVRMPTSDDVAEIHAAKAAMWHDLQLWMSWAFDEAKSIESTRSFVETNSNKGIPLIAIRKDTKEFCVCTGIDADDNAFETISTGYWVPLSQQGNGFATEATAAVLRFAFLLAGSKRAEICYHEGNEKSRKVIEKLGFRLEKVNVKSGKRCLDGLPIDVFDYAMTDPSSVPMYNVKWGSS